MLPLVIYNDSGAPEFFNHDQTAQNIIRRWINGDDNFEIKTSGSTGAPRSIIHTRKALKASAIQTGNALGLQAGDYMHVVIAPGRIGGMMQLIRALEFQMHIYIYEPEISVLEKLYLPEGRHHISVTPPMLRYKTLPNQLTTVLVGGAAADAGLYESIKDFPGAIYETYGMTETCSNLALKNLKEPGSHFVPLPDWKLTVAEDGVLHVQHDVISGSVLNTGDLVEWFDDGTFLYKGRADFIINSGSRKYIPEMMERDISKITSQTIYISSVPDETFGAFPVLMLREPPDAALRQYLRNGPYANVLRNYILLEEIPLTSGGKIDRNILKGIAAEAAINSRMQPF